MPHRPCFPLSSFKRRLFRSFIILTFLTSNAQAGCSDDAQLEAEFKSELDSKAQSQKCELSEMAADERHGFAQTKSACREIRDAMAEEIKAFIEEKRRICREALSTVDAESLHASYRKAKAQVQAHDGLAQKADLVGENVGENSLRRARDASFVVKSEVQIIDEKIRNGASEQEKAAIRRAGSIEVR